MKKISLLGKGIVAVGLLGALASGASAQSKMSDSKMSGSKMSGSKMSGSKMGSSMMRPRQMTGMVMAMTKSTLTVRPMQSGKMGTSKTVSIPAGAKFMMGAKSMKMSSLAPGAKVTVMMNAKGVVTRVNVLSGGSKGGSKMMPGSKMSGGKMSGSKMSGSKMSGKM